jgi:hypothetical protein
MAVDQVLSRPVQSIGSAGQQDVAILREGSQLDGRVLAVNSDESLRLATRYGVLDVDQSQVSPHGGGGGHGRARSPLPADLVGTTVKIEVAGQNTLTGRLLVRLISGGDTSIMSGPDHELPTPGAETTARIAAEVSQAAARQDGLAPVFSSAEQLAASSDVLPADVSQALLDLAGHALNADGGLSALDLRDAVAASGLFLEAKLTRMFAGNGAASAGVRFDPDVSLASQDLKAALFGLKSALDEWISASPPEEAIPGAALPVPIAAQSLLPQGIGTTDGTAGFDAEALFAVLRPPPVVSLAAPAASTAQASDSGLIAQLTAADLLRGAQDLATLAALGEWFQASGQMQSGGGRRGAYGGRPMAPATMWQAGARSVDASPSSRPPPPRRGSLPQGQAAIRAIDTAGRNPLDLARDLAQKTANALARVSLGQYASLAQQIVNFGLPQTSLQAVTSIVNPAQSEASWLFEIPLRLSGSTSIAQFEIDQIPGGGSAEASDGRAWRVQFAADVAPMGPVHGRLVLANRHLSVGLWAEDRRTAAALQGGLIPLRQMLEQADFVIDELHFSYGRPPPGPPVRAGGFVDRNA